MFILQVLLSQKQQSVDGDKNCCIFSVVGVVQIEGKRVFRLQISFKTSRVIKIDTSEKLRKLGMWQLNVHFDPAVFSVVEISVPFRS
jgi:hypothetical protein